MNMLLDVRIRYIILNLGKFNTFVIAELGFGIERDRHRESENVVALGLLERNGRTAERIELGVRGELFGIRAVDARVEYARAVVHLYELARRVTRAEAGHFESFFRAVIRGVDLAFPLLFVERAFEHRFGVFLI